MAGKQILGRDSVTVPIRMPRELRDQLQQVAQQRMTSVSDMLRQAAIQIVQEEESTDE